MTASTLSERETMDGPAMADAFAPGSILAGKYIVEREIAAGGSGIILLATHLELGQKVAIKYLRPGRVSSPMVLERFKREARLAASIRSEHVVRIYDVGALDDGTPYMVMEYLQGEDLAEVLKKEGPLAVDRAVQYTLQACEALREAHGAGIVHRDLKPANLFLATKPHSPPVIKIVDFGISKVSRASSFPSPSVTSAMTGRYERFGTPYYMSPEQLVSSANVDARSDIWAIGVVLYELLTARLPFEGDNLRQLVANVLSAPPAPLRERRGDVPPDLERIIHACLSYDAMERPENIEDLVERLLPFALKDPPRPSLRSYDVTSEISSVHTFGWVSAEPVAAKKPFRGLALIGGVGLGSIAVGAAIVVGLWWHLAPPAPMARTAARVEIIAAGAPVFQDVALLDAGSLPAAAPSARPGHLAKKPAAKAKSAPDEDFGGRQ